jgi:hypothetical protein
LRLPHDHWEVPFFLAHTGTGKSSHLTTQGPGIAPEEFLPRNSFQLWLHTVVFGHISPPLRVDTSNTFHRTKGSTKSLTGSKPLFEAHTKTPQGCNYLSKHHSTQRHRTTSRGKLAANRLRTGVNMKGENPTMPHTLPPEHDHRL